MHELFQTISHDMFHLPLPWLEKIIRPVIVYLVLIIFLRLFGKRELAQLNPLDLVVLLSLSNTVQNAIIGDDNSVSGGVIGAFALLTINWVLSKGLYRSEKFSRIVSGERTWLIKDGKVDEKALEKESMTHEELTSVLNKNGFNDISDVDSCALEPAGSFYVKGKKYQDDDVERSQILRELQRLNEMVQGLERKLDRVSD